MEERFYGRSSDMSAQLGRLIFGILFFFFTPVNVTIDNIRAIANILEQLFK
jgi:hypothetical protein